jgi:hypothetical protein
VNWAHDPWFALQATHPPLKERLLAIDPMFDGRFPRIHSQPPDEVLYNFRYQERLRRARAEAD